MRNNKSGNNSRKQWKEGGEWEKEGRGGKGAKEMYDPVSICTVCVYIYMYNGHTADSVYTGIAGESKVKSDVILYSSIHM
jgi:hypothetical protein